MSKCIPFICFWSCYGRRERHSMRKKRLQESQGWLPAKLTKSFHIETFLKWSGKSPLASTQGSDPHIRPLFSQFIYMLQMQCQFYMSKSFFIGHERIENITFIMLYIPQEFMQEKGIINLNELISLTPHILRRVLIKYIHIHAYSLSEQINCLA